MTKQKTPTREENQFEDPKVPTEYGNRFLADSSIFTYTTQSAFPRLQPNVVLVFHGLFGFLFEGSDSCAIGIHNTTQVGLPRHPHKFKIEVIKIREGNVERKPFDFEGTLGLPDFTLNVSNPKEVTDVRAFVDGENPPQDLRDWRWVIDLEREPFHPNGVGVDRDKMSPWIYVDRGLFYTLLRTTSTFKVQTLGTNVEEPLGEVAWLIACNIYLENNGQVRLRHSSLPESIDLPAIAGVTYQIHFSNECDMTNDKCKFTNVQTAQSRFDRNDFYLHYDVISINGGGEEKELILKESKKAPEIPDWLIFEIDDKYKIITNDAPCSGTGYGQGDSN